MARRTKFFGGNGNFASKCPTHSEKTTLFTTNWFYFPFVYSDWSFQTVYVSTKFDTSNFKLLEPIFVVFRCSPELDECGSKKFPELSPLSTVADMLNGFLLPHSCFGISSLLPEQQMLKAQWSSSWICLGLTSDELVLKLLTKTNSSSSSSAWLPSSTSLLFSWNTPKSTSNHLSSWFPTTFLKKEKLC